MAFLAAAFALALVDEVCDVCNVREERDAQDTTERMPTFDTLSSGLICTWKELISLVVSIPHEPDIYTFLQVLYLVECRVII